MKRLRELSPPPTVLLAGILGLVVVLVLWARSGPRPTMVVARQVEALLARPGGPRVLEQDPTRPVRVAALAPAPTAHGDGAILASLVLPPPAAAAFELAPGPADTRLELALGLGAEAFAPSVPPLAVRFEATLNGAPLLERVLTAGAARPASERRWWRGAVDVSSGGTLLLRTSFAGEGRSGIDAGFGILRRVVPGQVPRQRPGRGRPNVVLVVIDTLRWDSLGAYGDRQASSPTLDRLAREGTLFERAYASSSWTWPSTASILTGRTAPGHGLVDPEHCFLADSLLTVAEAFQAEGVTTAGFSANPLVVAGKNFDQGFETWREYPWTLTREILPDVAAWLDEFGEHRFFLYLQLVEPHTPYRPSAEARARFAAVDLQLRAEELLGLVERRVLGRAYPALVLEQELERMRKAYRAVVATVDTDLGHLRAMLEERGLADQTLWVVTSDHGEEFLEHDLVGHANQLHDESVRVPLILAGPGVPVGLRSSRPVENRFLPATLLALADLPVPPALAGPSLLDLASPQAAPGDPVFFALRGGRWPDPGGDQLHRARDLFAIQSGPLRLMWAPPQGSAAGRVALFDLEVDPRAHDDLAPQRPQEVAALKRAIELWRERWAARRPDRIPGGELATRELGQLGYGGAGSPEDYGDGDGD